MTSRFTIDLISWDNVDGNWMQNGKLKNREHSELQKEQMMRVGKYSYQSNFSTFSGEGPLVTLTLFFFREDRAPIQ